MRTYGFGLEPLDEDAVEERDDGLDGLESRLGSLRRSRNQFSRQSWRDEGNNIYHFYERRAGMSEGRVSGSRG